MSKKKLTSDELFEQWFKQASAIPVMGAILARTDKKLLKLAWLDGHENGFSHGYDDARDDASDNI